MSSCIKSPPHTLEITHNFICQLYLINVEVKIKSNQITGLQTDLESMSMFPGIHVFETLRRSGNNQDISNPGIQSGTVAVCMKQARPPTRITSSLLLGFRIYKQGTEWKNY